MQSIVHGVNVHEWVAAFSVGIAINHEEWVEVIVESKSSWMKVVGCSYIVHPLRWATFLHSKINPV